MKKRSQLQSTYQCATSCTGSKSCGSALSSFVLGVGAESMVTQEEHVTDDSQFSSIFFGFWHDLVKEDAVRLQHRRSVL